MTAEGQMASVDIQLGTSVVPNVYACVEICFHHPQCLSLTFDTASHSCTLTQLLYVQASHTNVPTVDTVQFYDRIE
jgi:hypothetical protein